MACEILRIKDKVYECEIVRRLNRFVVEVKVSGHTYRAYLNNTGRLREYIKRGREGFCLKNREKGKTEFRIFAVKDLDKAAIVDTQMQMKGFENALSKGCIPWLRNCNIVKRNVRLGKSLIDYLLKCKNENIYLEIKSAVLRGNNEYAMYPDCTSLRGRKHIKEIIKVVEGGGKAIILFIAAIPEVRFFKPYKKGDAQIPLLLIEAIKRGVMLKSINMFYDPVSRSICLGETDVPVLIK